jgi:hypothetical protein
MNAMVDKHDRKEDAPATFIAAIKSIGWAFLGIRARRGHENDLARLKPIHFIAAGLLGAFVFVMILILVIASVT